MERLKDEIPDAIELMREREYYQDKVKRDLNLIEGEKGALNYQRKEDSRKSKNAKSYVIIILVTAVLAFLMLMIFQKAMKVDVEIGYYILIGLTAVFVTACGVSYRNAISSQTLTEKQINRAIGLQNSVKIKYVNITNLLDYMYAKYNVGNSFELTYMWEKYIEERDARNHSEEVAEKLKDARMSLHVLLNHYKIKDPSLWIYQPGALVYDEELTELRHNLIVQRQRLRKGIDFNMYNLEDAKTELEDLVKEYPQYAKEILAIVTQYE